MNTPCTTVRDIAIEQSVSIRVFEKFGIDYRCGGRKSLAQACQERSLDPQAVLAAVEIASEARPDAAPAPDCTSALPLSSPCQGHIVRIAFIRREIYFRPSLRVNFTVPLCCEKTFPGTRGCSRIRGPAGAKKRKKVKFSCMKLHVNRTRKRIQPSENEELHGRIPRTPPGGYITNLKSTLPARQFQVRLSWEMMLFPYITNLECNPAAFGPRSLGCFGTVGNPIGVMMAEHDSAAEMLAEICELSRDYTRRKERALPAASTRVSPNSRTTCIGTCTSKTRKLRAIALIAGPLDADAASKCVGPLNRHLAFENKRNAATQPLRERKR